MSSASSPDPRVTKTMQFATFTVGDMFFGVQAASVQEVLRYQGMTPVPLAPAAIRGLINLRGQIVTAINTRYLLGIAPHEDREPMNIILQTEDGPVSLLVDTIGDVLEVDVDTFAPIPDHVSAEQRTLIAGVYTLHQRLMLVLHIEHLLEASSN